MELRLSCTNPSICYRNDLTSLSFGACFFNMTLIIRNRIHTSQSLRALSYFDGSLYHEGLETWLFDRLLQDPFYEAAHNLNWNGRTLIIHQCGKGLNIHIQFMFQYQGSLLFVRYRRIRMTNSNLWKHILKIVNWQQDSFWKMLSFIFCVSAKGLAYPCARTSTQNVIPHQVPCTLSNETVF